MMLRSSSTPILGSLLPSISSESPNHHHHHHHDTTLKPSPIHKFSPGSQHFTTLSCTSSPISPSVGHGRIRRAQSEGNLEHLISSGGGNGGSGGGDQFSYCNPNKKTSSRLHSYPLETIPSFSYQNSNFKSDDDESGDDGFGDFNVENTVRGLNKQLGFGNLVIKDEIEESGSQMYLAKGIGVDAGFGCADGDVVGGGGGGGRNLSSVGRGGDSGGDNHDVEEHYRKMEYYSRAILVDPNDGEILSQYAKLLWEVHHDKDRATSYFKRAVHVASEDSFLWEIEGEEDDDDEDEEGYFSNIPPLFSNGTMASATA
ncbi:hypothetical protein Ccrd_009237 [Cynara cardunculus var. scolymus]|uniref:Tetratricopeptide-like helical n=1 Tax=Cynara cardunculus var. scolymus TaxID=59895 RepID=A0A103YNG9_CYNCS|nr:hypothetical protein Ccrd_009237 [Cynara cardunculus var. scolymus]